MADLRHCDHAGSFPEELFMRSLNIAIVLLIWPFCAYATIIGEDNRERVAKHNNYTPSIGIILVDFEDGSPRDREKCTATLISDKHVITAAHCVYKKKYGFAKRIAFLPAVLTEDKTQNRRFFIERAWVLKRFMYSVKQSHFPNFDSDSSDIALLEINSHLDKPLGDIYGYQGVSYLEKHEEMENHEVVEHKTLFYSYPADKKRDKRSLWREQNCETRLVKKRIYASNCDTYVGASGGALFFKHPVKGYYYIYGINSAESEKVNYFTKITKELFQEIKAVLGGNEKGVENFISKNIDSSRYFSISLKNICHRKIYVALNFKSLEKKKWVSEGFFIVPPNKITLDVIRATDVSLGVYAQTKDGKYKWSGDFSREWVDGDYYNFFLERLPNHWVDRRVVFSCN